MKQILDSQEVFEAYAEIDLGYIALNIINKKIQETESPLEQLIDKATSKTKSQTADYIEDSIEIIENIIRCKKIIDAPFDNDEKVLNYLRNI